MDEYSWELGRGHRLLRHNLETVEHARKMYGPEGGMEAVFHIACDMGLVTPADTQWAKPIAKRKGKSAKKASKPISYC